MEAPGSKLQESQDLVPKTTPDFCASRLANLLGWVVVGNWLLQRTRTTPYMFLQAALFINARSTIQFGVRGE